jgi:uncharacterized protein (DUF2267 family)
VDLDTAERHARAVFTALGRKLTPQELSDLADELPKDFGPLLDDARTESETMAPEEIVPAEEFLEAVANRAGLDEQGARRAAEAVLEALGERTAGGEVEDMAAQLAPQLRPPLERGNERTAGKARRMSLEEFLERVAELEGMELSQATLDEARQHARAVLMTLREAISEKEFGDLMAELPDSYSEILR